MAKDPLKPDKFSLKLINYENNFLLNFSFQSEIYVGNSI